MERSRVCSTVLGSQAGFHPRIHNRR
ncbi:rCG42116 [Rattus norvegicus]|uniref:RCG42116 n=1 Tax=Rattus norvegicus TaxID=10116 RepID=A6JV47_RAT|nr:rCG42116 [Rattus norvegicus]